MNTINGKILNLQKNKIQKNFQGLTIENISSKPHLKHCLKILKNEIKLFHELQKYNERFDTTKMSKKWKNKKMIIEWRYLQAQRSDDIYNVEWDREISKFIKIDALYKLSDMFEINKH